MGMMHYVLFMLLSIMGSMSHAPEFSSPKSLLTNTAISTTYEYTESWRLGLLVLQLHRHIYP